MDANPVLVELTRGNWVENRHRAALVAALLLELATPDAAQSALLEQYASQTISNVRKREVGTLSARLDLVRAAVV